MPDFEVHIGLSRHADAPIVRAIPDSWKREDVFNLIALKGPHEFERHNVEGELLTLLTRHAASFDEVQEQVIEASKHCRGESSARVEVEQVLVSSGTNLAFGEADEFAFDPEPTDFPTLDMIPQTPPYEVHYCLTWLEPEDAVDVKTVAEICNDAAIGIDEVVHFGGNKITTTKFYKSLTTMMAELRADATEFLAALNRSGSNLRFRLIAERIITCGIPQ
ncbi:MAG TPA: hypothetical protein VIT45_00750 [Allosphingosinicella sp.]